MLLPRQFLDDVRPSSFNASPEQNLYGKIAPESGFDFLQRTTKRDTNTKRTHVKVKVEEADEKKDLYQQDQARSPADPCHAQRRCSSRESSPLVDGFIALSQPVSPDLSRDKRRGPYSGELNEHWTTYNQLIIISCTET